MSHRLFLRTGSALAAASVALLATGPAFAADPVAQASATALEVGIAGHGTETGTYTATNDGTRETTSGDNAPALPVAVGQQATNLGTLAQDAVTTTAGHSAACSGVAGEGATLTQVGDGTRCLTGGQTITLDAAHADFSKLQVLPPQITQGLDTTLADAVAGAVAPVVNQLLTALGNPGLGIDLGAVQASCSAGPTSARGTANIAHASAYLQAPAPIGHVDLVSLPVDPAPNTHVVTNLSAVAEAVQRGVDTQISTTLGGQAGTLGPLLQPLQLGLDTLIDEVQSNVTDALGPQLAPLEQNVLDIVLNKQSQPARGAIDVTALDLHLLPAARQFVDADLASVAIGHVTCGPNTRVAPAADAVPAVDTPSTSTSEPDTAVPTAVEAGAGSLDEGPSPLAHAALGGLVVAGTGAGVWGFRRSLRS
ncbi:hypothetical protein [Nocardioides sp. CER19]|uniref:hypothetical protein n=1 Tax=Nocardioides sp. CER19 TaxID=3038538 RepID=UPI00244A1124|nr:hypothetical protein [Nocardioides sp. CER19]MDH2413740.1 hypothetical protein [Nocardioides sp. CER19]